MNITTSGRIARVSVRQFVIAVLLLGSAGGCGPIWYIDASFAERLAKQENRPILFYFKAWDSTQHRNMKLNVLEHPPVKKALIDTVNVELEFAWYPGPEYAKRYGVRQPQVCVMCKPDGEMVGSSMYVNPVPTNEAFLDWLLSAKAEATPPPPATAPAGATPTPRRPANTRKAPAKPPADKPDAKKPPE